jgi:hypothetical protein
LLLRWCAADFAAGAELRLRERASESPLL